MSSFHIQTISNDVDLLALHASSPQRYPFLLQSVAKGPQGRFDILFAFPQDSIVGKNGDFLNRFESSYKEVAIDEENSSGLPFCGGWFVYLSYEIAGEVEPSLNLPEKNSGLPSALAVRIPLAIVIDHLEKRSYLVAEDGFEQCFADVLKDIEALDHTRSTISDISTSDIVEENPQRYIQQLEKIHHYIVEGDVFQVNISRLWQLEIGDTDEVALYRRLRQTNPAPFAGLMRWENHSVISSSPERLVRVVNRKIETRPIAGTRPREQQSNKDEQNKVELIAHPKERAEHVMLIDLERNDLGRVCLPGTVEVDELMVLESYAHVHHIVSNVKGILREDITPIEVIRAVFPGGTITGCPKVRCMEIIAELEQVPRGPYTGSFGYINRNGDMDLNILIRTLHLHDSKLEFRAGAGIVFDSDSAKELDETRAKAKGMLKVFNGDID